MRSLENSGQRSRGVPLAARPRSVAKEETRLGLRPTGAAHSLSPARLSASHARNALLSGASALTRRGAKKPTAGSAAGVKGPSPVAQRRRPRRVQAVTASGDGVACGSGVTPPLPSKRNVTARTLPMACGSGSRRSCKSPAKSCTLFGSSVVHTNASPSSTSGSLTVGASGSAGIDSEGGAKLGAGRSEDCGGGVEPRGAVASSRPGGLGGGTKGNARASAPPTEGPEAATRANHGCARTAA
mmetsp:Transcript_21592/g.71407  ORF Transcript_21592/g.71407 Transcript_21592/m.71407 type:complete len:242 (+) Transcript_21592:14-739(+)